MLNSLALPVPSDAGLVLIALARVEGRPPDPPSQVQGDSFSRDGDLENNPGLELQGLLSQEADAAAADVEDWAEFLVEPDLGRQEPFPPIGDRGPGDFETLAQPPFDPLVCHDQPPFLGLVVCP
jgi:hypothetical protein